MSDHLIEGVKQFQSAGYVDRKELFHSLGKGQQPHTAFITCSDSRIDPYLLTSSQPGDIFVIRTAGNIVPEAGGPPTGVTATVEYAVSALKVPNVVVCGHSACGAMAAICNPESAAALGEVSAWLEYAGFNCEDVEAGGPHTSDEARVEFAVKRNVVRQLDHLETYDFVQEAVSSRGMKLIGWYYDFVSGQVEVHSSETGEFGPI